MESYRCNRSIITVTGWLVSGAGDASAGKSVHANVAVGGVVGPVIPAVRPSEALARTRLVAEAGVRCELLKV